MDNKDRPLECVVEDDQLIIRIGIDTLAFSAEHCPLFYDDRYRKYPPYVKVTNKEELANDVVGRLLHEQDDGTTSLHELLDNAIMDAYDNGSLGFDEDAEN